MMRMRMRMIVVLMLTLDSTFVSELYYSIVSYGEMKVLSFDLEAEIEVVEELILLV